MEDEQIQKLNDLENSMSQLDKGLKTKIDKEIRKIELEFMVLNADVRTEMKTKENRNRFTMIK